MIQTIVYTTNTGSTEEYARLLGNRLGLPVVALKEAATEVRENTEILYLGWVMADEVRGYREAKQRFTIPMVCAVGITPNKDREALMREKNGVPEATRLFIIQGGYHPDKLKGIGKLLMKMVAKSTIKKLNEKESRTEEETDLLDLLKNGGSRVAAEKLEEVIAAYEEGNQTM